MKKRYILINTSIVIVSLILFLLVSSVIVSKTNQKNMESEIKSYLQIVVADYDGTNMSEVSDTLVKANSDLRITFISDDGVVLYDTETISEENHLTRPEILNLGTVYHRYSSTVGVKMFYIAAHIIDYTDPVYIRVSMPEASITSETNVLIGYGFSAIIIISLLCGILITQMSKRAVLPLKREIKKLSLIVGDMPEYKGEDILLLSYQIDKVRDMIEDKLEYISFEKEKNEYIIENMDQGLIIVDGHGDIVLVNRKALDVLRKKKENILNKNYLYISLEKSLSDAITTCQQHNDSISIEYKDKDNEYLVSVRTLDKESLSYDQWSSVAIFIYDVTNERRIERVKADFFANASHELKSPLTTIIGYQQMIEKKILTEPKEIAEATKCTVKEANRMNQIITDMLELSKLESNKESSKKDLSLARMCDDILKSYDAILNQRGIKVTRVYNDFNVNISSDDLYHLLRNLIDNSIKYNKDNGEIIIDIDDINNTISIKDSGIGIEEENLDRIYERFFRVDKAKSKEIGGTGLGLAIVKHICINNNLKIDVSSTYGEGSRFVVDFKNIIN